jgi:ATP-dependent DNA helicase RecG
MPEEQTPQKTTVYLPRLEQEILAVLEKNPSVTQKEIAHQLNIGSETVKEYVSKLKVKGVLRRVGPDKGGYWKVIQ